MCSHRASAHPLNHILMLPKLLQSVSQKHCSEVDVEVHKQMVRYNESPLFIVLNPEAAVKAKDLPVSIYEGEVHTTVAEQGNTVSNTIFVPQQFQLQTAQVRYYDALYNVSFYRKSVVRKRCCIRDKCVQFGSISNVGLMAVACDMRARYNDVMQHSLLCHFA